MCADSTGPGSGRASTARSRWSGRRWQSLVVKSLRRAVIVFLLLLLIEYLVVPELVGASKDLYLLGRVNGGWLAAGLTLEAASLFCYGLLSRALLPPGGRPSLATLVRIDLAAAAVAHVIPAGTVGSAGVGYRLFTGAGVNGNDAAVMMASKGLGSTVVLNVLLWLSLVISIPLAGFHPIYVSVAILGAVTLLAVAALTFGIVHGAPRASRILRAVGARIPRVGADRLENAFLRAGASLAALGRDRRVVTESLTWASLNWVLDAASLWCFVAAFGWLVNPVELFAAYGIANVAGVLPITPAGLGVIDSLTPLLLVSFGVTRSVATLGVLAWRLVNFWLPIPTGAIAYVSLQAGGGRRGLSMIRRALSELAARAGPSPAPDDPGPAPAAPTPAPAGPGPTGPAPTGPAPTGPAPARGPGAPARSAVVEAAERDLVEQQPDRRSRGDGDQRAKDPEQDRSQQHRDEADHGRDLDRAADDPGHDEVVLREPVRNVEAQRGDGHRQRDREGDQRDDDAPDRGPDHRD
jgi:uncharacterized protein (TIRG00374 family)